MGAALCFRPHGEAKGFPVDEMGGIEFERR